MTSAFEPSFSASLSRQLPQSTTAPSMAESLPDINFGFDDLRDRMAKFTAKFDAFIEQGRKRVLEERNQFRMNVAELHGSSLPRKHEGPTVWKCENKNANLKRRGSANEEEGY
jgi:kinetochore protein Spc25, fungi type